MRYIASFVLAMSFCMPLAIRAQGPGAVTSNNQIQEEKVSSTSIKKYYHLHFIFSAVDATGAIRKETYDTDLDAAPDAKMSYRSNTSSRKLSSQDLRLDIDCTHLQELRPDAVTAIISLAISTDLAKLPGGRSERSFYSGEFRPYIKIGKATNILATSGPFAQAISVELVVTPLN